MPANKEQTIQTAPSVVADNAHKGIALETLTARSAVFHFMSKYQVYEKLRKGSGLPEENKRGRGEDDGLIGQLLLHKYALRDAGKRSGANHVTAPPL